MKYSTYVEAEGELAQQLRFLARAVSDDETRFFMNDIEVVLSELPDDRPEADKEKNGPLLKAIATDGRRMHIVDPLTPSAVAIHGLEPGRWHVVSGGPACRARVAKFVEAPGAFPNYKKVLPEGPIEYTAEFNGFALIRERIARGSSALLKFFFDFPKPTAINLNYLADLGSDTCWKVEWRDERRAVCFRSGSKLAVIMPMQLE
jgi:hypothetical protein